MKNNTKLTLPGLVIVALALFGSSAAWAQSSGNFTARVQTTQCTINTVGGLTGGSLNNHNGGTVLETDIQTPNSKFTTLLVRPSLVTGLFTNTGVNDGEYSGNSAAVKVYVTLDGNPVAPATSSTPGIIYDQRFQQISEANASAIATCTVNSSCDVDFVMSTLAAHSFDFVAPNVGGGNHHLKVEWAFECTNSTGAVVTCTTAYTANTAGACAGPGTVTVTQVKNFSQTAPIVITQ
jgi:hypothetical protein